MIGRERREAFPSDPNGFRVRRAADEMSRSRNRHEEAARLLGLLADGALVSSEERALAKIARGEVYERADALDAAGQDYEGVLALPEGTSDRAVRAAALEGLARCRRARGATDEARTLFLQALELRQGEDSRAEERIQRALGALAEETGDPDEARRRYSASLALARANEDWAGVLHDLEHDGAIAGGDELVRTEAERRDLADELGEVAHAGAAATLRADVVAAARDAILDTKHPSSDDAGGDLVDRAERAFQDATALRKSNRSVDSLARYREAILAFMELDQPGPLSASLTGAGLAYLDEARAALGQDVTSSWVAMMTGPLESLVGRAQDLLVRQARALADRARWCHVWALELHKLMGSLGGQASRIANVALVEEFMGNLDTARRYDTWALAVHRQEGDLAAAAIDLRMLAIIDRRLGDDAGADEWERQREEADRGL